MNRVIAVPAMHEEVHERAKEKNQIGQHAEYVRGVLSDEKECRNG